ncbi:DUF4434 domain-containing protein [Leifsonia aquatica]|uniref:DUF4434 domain-containing protein n=1 Tax=Leifsonia aquatica TaxID=144185 RepID=UPI00384E6517
MDRRVDRRMLSLVMGIAFAAAALIAPPAATAAPTCGTSPRLEGSFVQPGLVDGWSDAQLSSAMSALTDACITSQVLNWTADTQASTTVFRSDVSGFTQSTKTDVVSRVLTAADRAGVAEYIGLQRNPDWWTKHATSAAWLDEEATKAIALADDLHAQHGSHASFAGWYLVFEVDNWYFTKTTSWDNLASFYSKVAEHLHALTPGKPVIIAPFFNPRGGQTTSEWTTMWSYILSRAPIDVIAVQNGAGAGRTPEMIADLFAATKAAIDTGRPETELWSDSELFTSDYQVKTVDTIVADLKVVAPYVSKILSFSYDHHYSPVVKPAMWDATYRDYVATGLVETSPPTMPTGMAVTDGSATSVSLSWKASTDNVGVAGYNVYRDGALVTSLRGSATIFTDTGLQPMTAYEYTVAAYDPAGNVSDRSAATTATTLSVPDDPLISKGAPYTASLPAHANYPDTGGLELTDGATGSTSYAHAAWQGRATGSAYSFTIDLGEMKTVTEVNTSWLQRKGVSIYLPKGLEVSVSTDGVTFVPLATVGAPKADDADKRHTYIADGLSGAGRYVKLTVTPDGNRFSFVDEVSVHGF